MYQSTRPATGIERGHGVKHSPVVFEDRCDMLVCRLGVCDELRFCASSWNLTDASWRAGLLELAGPSSDEMDLNKFGFFDVD